jgi:hypothetical protein
MNDRYLKIVLTVIALELGWIAVNQSTTGLEAQAGVTPVVIRGIDVRDNGVGALPVAIVGSYRTIPADQPQLLRTLERTRVAVAGAVQLATPVDVRTITPVKIEADQPIPIATDRPLKVESVPYTPSQRPGE